MDGHRVNTTIITTVYAPTPQLAKFALFGMKATAREFPRCKLYAGIDAAMPHVYPAARALGFEVVTIDEGAPPRMGTLLNECIQRVETETFWTIEHDVRILPGSGAAVTQMLESYPSVASIECITLEPNKAVGKPASFKQMYRFNTSNDIWHQIPYQSLCCVAWRTSAVREVDWSMIPPWPAIDKLLSWQLMRRGWDMCISPVYGCIHYDLKARGHLPAHMRRPREGPCISIIDRASVLAPQSNGISIARAL